MLLLQFSTLAHQFGFRMLLYLDTFFSGSDLIMESLDICLQPEHFQTGKSVLTFPAFFPFFIKILIDSIDLLQILNLFHR